MKGQHLLSIYKALNSISCTGKKKKKGKATKEKEMKDREGREKERETDKQTETGWGGGRFKNTLSCNIESTDLELRDLEPSARKTSKIYFSTAESNHETMASTTCFYTMQKIN